MDQNAVRVRLDERGAGRRPRMVVRGVWLLAVAGLCASCTTTRIGIFIPRQGGGISVGARDSIAEADELGVGYMRMEQQLTQPLNADIKAFVAAGKKVNMVAKVGTGTISQPPADLEVYKANLAARLDEYRTPLLAIENEETADNFYAGTPDQYLAELRAAVQVAHGRGVEITNGGIPFVPTALVTWNHLRTTRGTAAADRYIAEAFDSAHSRLDQLAAGLTGYPVDAVDPYDNPALPLPANLRSAWRDAEYLYSQYGTDPTDVEIDYVNFHWYVTDETNYTPDDTQALRDTIDYLQETTHKRAVTNEIGQWGTSPEAVTATLRVLMPERNLPWALWFDHDGIPAHGLHDYDPADFDPARDLRPNGQAFKQAVLDWKPRPPG